MTPRIFSILFVLLGSTLSSACEYTVRDIGFVKLGGADYSVILVADRSLQSGSAGFQSNDKIDSFAKLRKYTPDDKAALVQRLTEATKPLNCDWSLWLVDSDEDALLLKYGDQTSFDDLQSSLRNSSLNDSELLEQVATNSLNVFAHIIYFEGQRSDARVDEAIDGAVTALARVAKLLPRPVELSTEQIVVAFQKRDRERVALWSIAARSHHDQEPATWLEQPPQHLSASPVVCVVYGNGRLAGGPLIGEQIQLEEILAQLVLVGQSCECGTDRSWIDLPRLPIPWQDSQSDDAIHHLGFNPSSPLVKSEIRRILQRSATNRDAGIYQDDVENVVTEFRRQSLELETASSPDEATGRNSIQKSNVKATVIAGEGWGFETQDAVDSGEVTLDVEVSESVSPELVRIPGGHQQSTDVDAGKSIDGTVVSENASQPNSITVVVAFVALTVFAGFLFWVRSSKAG